MNRVTTQDEVPTLDAEQGLILVDAEDREIGYASREECHRGSGLLHRAFSVLVFRADGRLWLQQRAATKRLWPQSWSNTCCSHPRRGEQLDDAARRRLFEEAGLRSSLAYVYRFEYRAAFDAYGAEHELCSVFVGIDDAEPSWNPHEVLAARCLAPEEVEGWLSRDPDSFTPWFKLEWRELRERRIPEMFFGSADFR